MSPCANACCQIEPRLDKRTVTSRDVKAGLAFGLTESLHRWIRVLLRGGRLVDRPARRGILSTRQGPGGGRGQPGLRGYDAAESIDKRGVKGVLSWAMPDLSLVRALPRKAADVDWPSW